MDTLLVVSSRAHRRHEAVEHWLLERPSPARAVLLAPSRSAADDLLHRLSRARGGVFGVQRTTPIQLASELASVALARSGRAPVAGLGALALAVRAAHEARTRGQLEVFGPVAHLPGFPRALAATLRELRLAGVGASELAALRGTGPDLAVLLRAYEASLADWSLADAAEIFRHGAEDAAREPPLVRALPMVWLDLLPESEGEERFLRAVRNAAGPMLATVPAEAPGEGRWVERLEELLEVPARDLDLEAGAVSETQSVPRGPRSLFDAKAGPSDAATASRLERVQRFVFSPDVPPAGAAADVGLDFFSAAGEGGECVEIARRARDLADSGIPFDDMAILVRSPTTYLPLIEDALRRARIPAYLSRGTARPDPSGRAFLALLACAIEGLTASRFAEYLSLAQVPELEASGAPPRVEEVPWVEPSGEQFVFKSLLPAANGNTDAAREGERETLPADEAEAALPGAALVGSHAGSLAVPPRWERLLVDASVVGGRERWERRLRGLEGELRLRLEEAGGEDDAQRAAIGAQLEQVGHLQRFALPLIGFLDALPKAATWGEWLAQLERLAAMALRRPESVLALLAELRPMDEVGPHSLEHVLQVLSERLTMLRAEPPRRRYGRVFVSTLEEIVGRSFDVVFLPGLAEGIFPRRALEDPLLLDELRERLGHRLRRQDQRLRSERLLLHLAVSAARSLLVASYPRVDVVSGRQRVPSFYALDLLRAAEGRLPDLRELGQRAARASSVGVGWPAPASCDQAIDDAEYDLALLQPLLQRPSDETRGQGQFLLRANECLARSLRTRARRWRPRWTAADGIVEPSAETGALLAEHRVKQRSYSPTALQHYAACPYRFFLQAIVRLRPRDELVVLEQLDPLTRGSLFHEIQFQLFAELRAHDLLPVRPDNLTAVLDLVDAVLERCAARYREKLAPAIPRIFEMEIEGLRTDLRGWIRKISEDDVDWRPIHAELAFGLELGPGRDPSSSLDPVRVLDGVSLRGSIDLVEQHQGGTKLRVTDHKSGRALRESRVVTGGGLVLQPLLYAMAAEALLVGGGQAGGPSTVESGRLFYCTQRGEYRQVDVRLDEHGRDAVRAAIDVLDDAIAEGFLPAAPAEGQCRFCDYRLICGPWEELRVSRKRPQPLEPLIELRRQP